MSFSGPVTNHYDANAAPPDTPDCTSVAAWRHVPVSPFARVGAGEGVDLTSVNWRAPVTNSEDLERVVALPRRPQVTLTPYVDCPSCRTRLSPPPPNAKCTTCGVASAALAQPQYDPTALALVDLMSERLRRKDNAGAPCRCHALRPPPPEDPHAVTCVTSLQPAQAWALYEAPIAGGLLGSLMAGSGKTSLNFLLPMVMGIQQCVLLLPSSLVKQFVREYELWAEHWVVANIVLHTSAVAPPKTGGIVPGRPTVHVIPYSVLSDERSTKLLEDLNPGLVMGDECHRVANPESVRRNRVMRLAGAHPETRYGWWSGTVTDKSIQDFAGLSALALRRGSPVPIDPHKAEEWALALDPSDRPAQPGALGKLCAPGETLERGFHRRLVETRGVVATRAGALGSSLNLHERDPGPVPPEIAEYLENPWTRPDGEEAMTALEAADNARELSCGFHYRWAFPGLPHGSDGQLTRESVGLIEEWLARRKAWRKEVRGELYAREVHLDSPELLEKAAARAWAGVLTGEDYAGDLPVWRAESYRPWVAIRDRVSPVTEAVWVSDYLAADAAEWAQKRGRRGVVWYLHDAFGVRISQLSGLPLHNGGPGGDARLQAERGDRSIIASIKSYGEGRDGLQRLFHEQLVANPPSSGRAWEQLLARLHRVGQRAPEVDTWVYRHTTGMRTAIDRAVRRAKYVAATWEQDQRLLMANCTFTLDEE